MTSLIELQNQIAKLQKQAVEIKAKEFDKTVQEIVVKMQAFGITLQDIRSASSNMREAAVKRQRSAAAKVRGAKRVKMPGAVVAPKYRGPNGETWSGRGLMPRWLTALVTQGRSKEDFAVANKQDCLIASDCAGAVHI